MYRSPTDRDLQNILVAMISFYLESFLFDLAMPHFSAQVI